MHTIHIHRYITKNTAIIILNKKTNDTSDNDRLGLLNVLCLNK